MVLVTYLRDNLGYWKLGRADKISGSRRNIVSRLRFKTPPRHFDTISTFSFLMLGCFTGRYERQTLRKKNYLSAQWTFPSKRFSLKVSLQMVFYLSARNKYRHRNYKNVSILTAKYFAFIIGVAAFASVFFISSLFVSTVGR